MGVDAIAAVSVARPLRAGVERYGAAAGTGQWACPPNSAADRRGYPPSVHIAAHGRRRADVRPRTRPVAGSSALTWPSKPVRTSRPPTSSAAVTTSEWATRQATVPSASIANVSISAWTRTWASRDEPSSATIGVAERCSQRGLAGRRRRGRRCGTRRRRPAARRVSQWSARGSSLISRREAGGPGAARALDPQLGAAQRRPGRRRPAARGR